MHENISKVEFTNFDENLFEYLSNKYLWNSKIYEDKKFNDEIIDLKKYGIKIKQAYYFYCHLGKENGKKFQKEIENFAEEISNEEKSKNYKKEINENNENNLQGNTITSPSSNDQITGVTNDKVEVKAKEGETEDIDIDDF